MAYVLLAGYLALSALLYKRGLDAGRALALYMINVFLLVMFIGFRYEVGGPDWVSYKQFFKDIEPLSAVLLGEGAPIFWGHGFEFLFKVVASSIKLLRLYHCIRWGVFIGLFLPTHFFVFFCTFAP